MIEVNTSITCACVPTIHGPITTCLLKVSAWVKDMFTYLVNCSKDAAFCVYYGRTKQAHILPSTYSENTMGSPSSRSKSSDGTIVAYSDTVPLGTITKTTRIDQFVGHECRDVSTPLSSDDCHKFGH